LLALVGVIASSCRAPNSPAVTTPGSAAFDQWAEKFTAEWVSASPQMGNRLRYFTGAAQDAIDRDLSMIGEWDYAYGNKGFSVRAGQARRGMADLAAMDARTLSPEQLVSLAVIRWTLQDQIDTAAFAHHRYIFDQFNGLQVEMVNHFVQTITIQSPRDVANYLAALALVALRLDEGISEARAAAAEGIVPPRIVIQRSIEQIDGLLEGAPRDNAFVSNLDKRIGSMTTAIAPAERKTALAAAEKTVSESLIPAYRRVRNLLAEQLTRAPEDVGVWRLPNGAAYYAQQLASYTSTTMSAEDIHALGLKEVARLESEMDSTLKQLGYASGTVNERYDLAQAAAQPRSEEAHV